MNPILETHKKEIIALCRKYGLERLEAFSFADESDPASEAETLEFIAKFVQGSDLFLRYTDFSHELENLLGRPVVLVDEKRLRREYLQIIADSREVIFASADRTVAA